MITYEDALPADPISAEARIVEGPRAGTWPVAKPDMADRAAIVGRMAEDALKAFDAEGRVTEDALVRTGWPRASVTRHGDAARDAFVRLLGARYRARHGAPTMTIGSAA